MLGFLILYNSVHLALRFWGLPAGWSAGIQVSRRLGAPAIKQGLRIAGPLAALAVGFALPIVAAWLVRHLDGNELIGAGLILGIGVVFARWIWPTLGGNRFGLAAVALALLLGAL